MYTMFTLNAPLDFFIKHKETYDYVMEIQWMGNYYCLSIFLGNSVLFKLMRSPTHPHTPLPSLPDHDNELKKYPVVIILLCSAI